MYTVCCVEPLGVASDVHAVEPLYARRRVLPDVTAEKVDAVETLLPHTSAPLDTAQLPLDVVIVKLDALPEIVYVAGVWVDQVPAVSSPPVVLACRCALDGRPVVVGEEPLL